MPVIEEKLIQYCNASEIRGRLRSAAGVFMRARIPEARIGDICNVEAKGRKILAKVVAIDSGEIILMPFRGIDGVSVNSEVVVAHNSSSIYLGRELPGRILDGLGRPVDGRGRVKGESIELNPYADPPPPLARKMISSVFNSGIRVIDGLLTVAEGQRMGIFAGAGVGKSTLLGMICRNASSDINVIALIGERGREVGEFIEEVLGENGIKKSVIVVSTSDESALMKINSAYTATAIAEHFRDEGKRVLLMMDSITRFARALRELGLASGEPPARQGFPPSVFATLPGLLERSGMGVRGSITAFYTVLSEGDDTTEPVSDEVKSILDGHIILSRGIAARGIYPAVDILNSVSRVMPRVVSQEHLRDAGRFRTMLASYESKRDMINLGMYSGGDALVDFAMENMERINRFLAQPADERSDFESVLKELRNICSEIPD